MPKTDEPDGVLEQLGAEWRLGARSAERLKPAIRSALASGWMPTDLAAQLGNSADGVRSPYAVLNARLADLPDAPAPRPKRPAWCGECHEATRMREAADGAPFRCPACHPGGGANWALPTASAKADPPRRSWEAISG